MGEVLRLRILDAEAAAPRHCSDPQTCCSKIVIDVVCVNDPSMAIARRDDPLAAKACRYKNTYKCPDSRGGGGGSWENPTFDEQ